MLISQSFGMETNTTSHQKSTTKKQQKQTPPSAVSFQLRQEYISTHLIACTDYCVAQQRIA